MFKIKNITLLAFLILNAYNITATIELPRGIISTEVERNIAAQASQFIKDIDGKVSKDAITKALHSLEAQLNISAMMTNATDETKAMQIQAELQAYSNQLNEFMKTAEPACNALLQRIAQESGALVTTPEMQSKIAAFEKRIQELEKEVREGKVTEADAQAEVMSMVQDQGIQDMVIDLMPKQTAALLIYYDALYEYVAKKIGKNSLLRKFDKDGAIAITKRKEQISHPDSYKTMITRVVNALKEQKQKAAHNA